MCARKIEPKFLPGAALLLEPGKVLAVGDLHLGLEHEILKSGIMIPSQTEKIKERIDSLVRESKAKQLVFLGDVKHNIPAASFQEDKEIPLFLNHVRNQRFRHPGNGVSVDFAEKIKVSLVKGNHDGGIEKLSPRGIKIYPSSGFKMKNFWLAHGQSWPPPQALKCECLVIGHDHPAVEFRDNVGSRSVEQCWLISEANKEKLEKKYERNCKLEKIISVPVFSRLIGGMPFNKPFLEKSACGKTKFKPLSPILQISDWRHSEAYLLDGTFLGTLDRLKKA